MLSARGRANCGSAAARCSIAIWRVRNLIDRAEEESATTQSLIIGSSRIPSQATPEHARSQLHSPMRRPATMCRDGVAMPLAVPDRDG
jgi:hypothetical protein